jgi:predicted nucleotidyltransferase
LDPFTREHVFILVNAAIVDTNAIEWDTLSRETFRRFQTHRAAIRRIVEAHRACNPRVFGSVAQGCDMDGSDLDVLVDPTPEPTLLDIGAIRHELLQLLGVPVDVLTPLALPEKFRAAVLAEAIVV